MLYLENLLEYEMKAATESIQVRNPVTPELRLKLIEMLCKTSPENVLSRVISYDIPLDGSLELVREAKIRDASAYLEYKLGRVAKSFEEFKLIMRNSFIGFEKGVEDLNSQEKYLSDAYFAYEMCIKICDQALDNPEEGKQLYLGFLQFLIKIYIDLIEKHSDSSLEEKILVLELLRFIFSTMIQEIIVLIARDIGVSELFKVTEMSDN